VSGIDQGAEFCNSVATAMKEIVVICLAIDAETGAIDRAAAFVVIPYQRPHRGGVYDNEPNVNAQFQPCERQARFEAAWNDERGDWTFGKRVDDA
jgi:hypothetical protein